MTAPCGAAALDLGAGDIRYDDVTPGAVVGVPGDRLFALDDPEGAALVAEPDYYH